MNIGDYVRNKYGIAKVIDIENNNGIDILVFDEPICFLVNKETGEIKDDRLSNRLAIIDGVDVSKVKSSPNIIDLIELGDYVNGCLIVEISKDPFIKGQINLWTNMIISEGEPFPNEYYKAKILEKDIKNVVTKEQFSSMQYNLK